MAKFVTEMILDELLYDGKSIREWIQIIASKDCISRQTVKKQMIKYGFHAPDMTVTEFIEDLPSVVLQESYEDAISRQAVLEKLHEYFDPLEEREDVCPADIYHEIKALSSVTPKQKTGHLIPRNSFLLQYKCSECGRNIKKYNFCPHCGAKMIEP